MPGEIPGVPKQGLAHARANETTFTALYKYLLSASPSQLLLETKRTAENKTENKTNKQKSLSSSGSEKKEVIVLCVLGHKLTGSRVNPST